MELNGRRKNKKKLKFIVRVADINFVIIMKGVDSHAKNATIMQSRAEQSRAEQSRAEQSRAEQSRAEQSRAEQSRAWAGYGLFSDKIIYDDG